jgi:membrane protein implicated in regulation of membrane protease activity
MDEKLWLACAVGAVIFELFTLNFFCLMLAGGAVCACLAAWIGLGVSFQVLLFAGSAGVLLTLVRPALRRRIERTTAGPGTNIPALVGRDALVLEPVSDRSGAVKLAGEVWTARVPPGATELEKGSRVRVARIEGAIAIVHPEHIRPPDHIEWGGTA